MKNTLMMVSDKEEVIKEFSNKRERAVVTAKRLILENDECSYSIRLDAIGAIQIIRKSAKKSFLRIYTLSGGTFFPYMKGFCVQMLTTDELAELEKTLSSIMYGTITEEQ